MSENIEPLEVVDGSGLWIGIARSRFNGVVTSGLAEGAVAYLKAAGASFGVEDVPGAFELPLIAAHMLEKGYDAVVALGAVIDGDTDHYEHVATQAARGLMDVMLATGKPVAFGVLTVRDGAHAVTRSQPGPGNKGAEAAAAAVEAANLIRFMGERPA